MLVSETARRPVEWRVKDRVLTTEQRALVMGIVNVTPDSFSDGGALADSEGAVRYGLGLAAAGADLVDVGGESTRPGADPVAADEEIRRTVPVVRDLAAAGVAVSIDTSKPEVAAAATDAGAVVINDVTALSDPAMAELAADSGAGVVLMHMTGEPRTMQEAPHYRDVVAEVDAFLEARAALAEAAGVAPQAICVDPGIGFGKTLEHNLDLLAHLDVFVATGRPVLVGTSRKSFLGKLTGIAVPADRDLVTAVTTGLAIAAGAAVVRVHDVAAAVDAALVAGAIVHRRQP